MLSPHRFAPLIAPAIDRVFTSVMAASRSRGGADLSQRYGGPPAVGYLIEFRTRLAAPDGTVSRAGFAAVNRYRQMDRCLEALSGLAERGTIRLADDGSFAATELGHQFLTELYELHARVTDELWAAEFGVRVNRLAATVSTLLDAAIPTGGPALKAMNQPHEPTGTPMGAILLNRLGTLRYHRSDAHAAAWQAAGLTAAEIVEMPPGPDRDSIEDDTNLRAAAPYAVLTPEQRLLMLADLAALPVTG